MLIAFAVVSATVGAMVAIRAATANADTAIVRLTGLNTEFSYEEAQDAASLGDNRSTTNPLAILVGLVSLVSFHPRALVRFVTTDRAPCRSA